MPGIIEPDDTDKYMTIIEIRRRIRRTRRYPSGGPAVSG